MKVQIIHHTYMNSDVNSCRVTQMFKIKHSWKFNNKLVPVNSHEGVLKSEFADTCSFLDCLSDLSEAIDVYSEWIDACEQANQ